MSNIIEPEDEEGLEGMLDEESDDDDEDYIPDKKLQQQSDSDPEYSAKSRVISPKSKKQKPKEMKFNRRASSRTPSKVTKSDNKKTPTKRNSRSSRQKSSHDDDGDDAMVTSPLRRSSRSSMTRSISYADADVSDEDIDEEDIVFETKNKDERKKHVDELWSTFKDDTTVKTKRPSRKSSPQKNTATTVLKIDDDSEEEVTRDGDVSNTETKELTKTEAKTITADNDKLVVDLTESSVKKGEEKIDKTNEKLKTTEKNKLVDIKNNESTGESYKDNGNKIVDTPKKKEETSEEALPPTGKLSVNNKVEITESYDFAGEEIKVKKIVDAASLEKNVADTKEEACNSSASSLTKVATGLKRSGAGLSGVIGSLEKKKKISVLDKSKLDWNSFKDDAGIEDELKSNRNAGYLDKQEFLQRVDYKQWENEREMRLLSNRK